MNKNYILGNVNDALPVLMADLLNADEVGSRAGRTFEMTHVGITLTRPWQREIVLPTRKASIAAQIAETMWVLTGRTDMEFLSLYLPRARDFSDDGETWRAGYGQRLRDYQGIDQVAQIVDTLRFSPGTRQAVATIWDPTVDNEPGKDIACNNWLHFLSRLGKLDLMVGIRSNDAMWGWSGINAFEWSALLEIVAGMAGLEVGSLHFATGSFHLYDQHWSKASKIANETGNFMYDDSPRFDATGLDDMESFDYLAAEWFRMEERIRLRQPVDIESFPEPMLRSWLRVLQWWWTGNHEHLLPLRHTRLYEACKVGVQPKVGGGDVEQRPSAQVEPSGVGLHFVEFVDKLHTEKHLAYGDSWCRRGEYMILANIARKVDRLEGGADTPDETQIDTAIDLLVYLAKYDSWLNGGPGDPNAVRNRLLSLEAWHQTAPHETNLDDLPKLVVAGFTDLEIAFDQTPEERRKIVGSLMEDAYCLAWTRWSE